ncbi:response regulator transcription factor [Clostridium arbusti]|uniref:response regulator transcription factor n=1 Tax=Clostridium arbusti TaxID=1137848 RepID=UPI00028A357F|nr:response regulator [Clostridium arbusti]
MSKILKILIVDDSNFSQKITSNLIKKTLGDVEIYFANDGKDGFNEYKRINPDYIFVDLLMPKLNGKDMIKLIKEYDSDSKIIIISADVQKSIKDEMEQFGILGFVNKPLNHEKMELICNDMMQVRLHD